MAQGRERFSLFFAPGLDPPAHQLPCSLSYVIKEWGFDFDVQGAGPLQYDFLSTWVEQR